MDPRVARVKEFFESLAPADVARLPEFYAAQAYFKDPFNEVRGAEAVGRIFTHMFKRLESPRFVIREAIVQGDDAFLTWDFPFRLRSRELLIHGASHLKFDADGRIAYHRDYWDAAEELYEKLPLLGGLMRLLKRQAAS